MSPPEVVEANLCISLGEVLILWAALRIARGGTEYRALLVRYAAFSAVSTLLTIVPFDEHAARFILLIAFTAFLSLDRKFISMVREYALETTGTSSSADDLIQSNSHQYIACFRLGLCLAIIKVSVGLVWW